MELLDAQICVESCCGISEVAGSILGDSDNTISYIRSVMGEKSGVCQGVELYHHENPLHKKKTNGYEKNRLMIQEYENSPNIQNNKYFCH